MIHNLVVSFLVTCLVLLGIFGFVMIPGKYLVYPALAAAFGLLWLMTYGFLYH